ncbi:MAG: RNA polymerase sigma factor [Acidobacteria bacterium]|nr:RNA polymerase sigma factor [Verrucomicrobiales bacterium]MCI0724035.1 RNA polymerase sigma factor [Acidobacteriota bacterium]
MHGPGHTAALALTNLAAITDEKVVARVCGGEAALFEILMRRHNQRVYRVARAILGNDTEAEEVMQEAYVRAYMHLDQFENRAKFSTWLTRIAVHEALARLRKAGRLETLDSEVDSETDMRPEPMSNTRSPEEQLFGKQMQVLLEAAVDALPQAYRSVFVMREIEEMSTAETAEALGVTEEVIKTRLHRARGLLQTDLYSRVGSTTPSAFEFHLSRCDRVVNAVLGRVLMRSSSPKLLE